MSWLEKQLREFAKVVNAEDVQATLIELTAASIAQAVTNISTDQIFVCGGGIHNQQLSAALEKQFTANVQSTKVLGIDPDYMEAIAFAWLAKRRLEEKPAVVSSVTGASVDAMSGCVYLPSR